MLVVAENWIDSVMGAECVGERLMVVRVRVRKIILNFVSPYASQGEAT